MIGASIFVGALCAFLVYLYQVFNDYSQVIEGILKVPLLELAKVAIKNISSFGGNIR